MEILSKKLLMAGTGEKSGRFVVVGQDSNQCVYSDNGITWSAATLPDSTNWFSVAAGNGKFVAFASNGTYNYCAYSQNGNSWSRQGLPGAIYATRGVKYGQNKFVAVGYVRTNTSSNPPVYNCLHSSDGLSWVPVTPSSGSGFMTLHFLNNVFYAGSQRGAPYYSGDGANWMEISGVELNGGFSGAYGKGKYIFAGYSESYISSDGVNFAQLSNLPGFLQYVDFGKNMFVAVGDANISGATRRCVFYSYDGSNWGISYIFPAGTPNLKFIKYGNGIFVVHAWASAAESTIYYSSDAVNWNSTTLPVAMKSNDVTIG